VGLSKIVDSAAWVLKTKKKEGQIKGTLFGAMLLGCTTTWWQISDTTLSP
jgi:hypothetical protein